MGWQHFWVGKNYFEYKRFKKKKRKKKRKAYGIYFQKKKFRFKNPMTLKKKKIHFKTLQIQNISLIIFLKGNFQLGKRKDFFFKKRPSFSD